MAVGQKVGDHFAGPAPRHAEHADPGDAPSSLARHSGCQDPVQVRSGAAPPFSGSSWVFECFGCVSGVLCFLVRLVFWDVFLCFGVFWVLG